MGQERIHEIDSKSDAVIKYQKKIEDLINKLNDLNSNDYPEQVNKTVQQIKAADQQFITNSGLTITGHVLFSRHGESSEWSKKKLGFRPNAGLEDRAFTNMANTNQFTSALLNYPDKKTNIAVSPLVRAKQTASLVIPANIKEAQIIIEPALSENSFTPSGNNISSLEQLKQEYNKMTFWQTPVKVILFLLSIWLYQYTGVFKRIQDQSSQADQTMLNINGINKEDYFSRGVSDPETGYFFDTNSIPEQEKIKATRQLIKDNLKSEANDYWLFGHGQNFRLFFETLFGINSPFEYGETRSVYNVQKVPGISSLFSPPYTLVIDQTTGNIRGKYTENTLALEINRSRFAQEQDDPIIVDSPVIMYQRGLAPVSSKSAPSIPGQRTSVDTHQEVSNRCSIPLLKSDATSDPEEHSYRVSNNRP